MLQLAALDEAGQALRHAREAELRAAFAKSAQYICLAFALAPVRAKAKARAQCIPGLLGLQGLPGHVLVCKCFITECCCFIVSEGHSSTARECV